MRICYVLLSPTYGMHQYTAHLANGMVDAGLDVQLVTTSEAPRDRYSPEVTVEDPVANRTTGLSMESLRASRLREVQQAVAAWSPDVVHFTGPHVWNVPLVKAWSSQGIPVVHTIHDLEPHQRYGIRYEALLRVWNRLILRSSDHILVHCEGYRERLIQSGLPSDRVTSTPLLHLPLSFARQRSLAGEPGAVEYEPWVLFLGRLEPYKGLECLLSAYQILKGTAATQPGLVIAGPGNVPALWRKAPPDGVEMRNRHIEDDEAVELLRRCGLLVMPYLHATQSALVATAYFFHKPVLASRTGALPEYVQDGRTGHLVEPDEPVSLARCLGEMLRDHGRLAAMGSAGRRWYEHHRRAETETLISMYNDVIQRLPC
ncbi:MAG: glycosyltransferase family 4 protein [Gemmatimonadales bacterium]